MCFPTQLSQTNIGLQKTHRHTRGQGTTDGKTRSRKPKKHEPRHNNQNARTYCVNTRAKFWTPSEGVQKNGVLAFRGSGLTKSQIAQRGVGVMLMKNQRLHLQVHVMLVVHQRHQKEEKGCHQSMKPQIGIGVVGVQISVEE